MADGPKKLGLTGWPAAATIWLEAQRARGLSPRTLDAYARGLADYLTVCAARGVDPMRATRADVAAYVRDLTERPSARGHHVIALDSGAGLANATIQQRLVAVRLFYDQLVEDGALTINPAGRGRFTARNHYGSETERGLVPRFTRLPWIPTDEQWQSVLSVAAGEPVRNRLMFAMAYDAALRREELCSLHAEDIDPAYRTLRVRAETTKTRRERVVPYSAATSALLKAYLPHRRAISRARGPLFISESRRNKAEPITLWTWSKVVRSIALRSGVGQFSAHTLRHLCLTDLARSGWELHTIARFAGHSNTSTTLQYIHLSGRDLAKRLGAGMAQVHEWRVTGVTTAFSPDTPPTES